MYKIIIFFLFQIYFSSFLNAKEPVLATLLDVISNSTQKFTMLNFTFYCKPYGVLSIDTILDEKSPDSVCRSSLLQLYSKNPKLKYFSQNLFNTRQNYHIEFKEQKCLIYLKGEKTLSELLLEEGLAINRSNFADDEFKHIFINAQNRAKSLEKGIYKNSNLKKSCIVELYKVY